jgi:hypothetical protein
VALPSVPLDEARVWFAMAGRERIGPLSAVELASLRQAGALEEQAFIWRPGMETWQPLAEVPEFFKAPNGASAVPPPVSVPSAPLSAPTTGGAAARLDAFGAVPDAPRLRQASAGDTTNAVIAASGARRSRLPALLLGVGLVVAVVGAATRLSLRRIPSDVTSPPISAAAPAVDVAQVAPLDEAAARILAGGEGAAAPARRPGRDAAKGDAVLAGLVPAEADGASPTPGAQLALLEAARNDNPVAGRPAPAPDDGFDAVRAGPDARGVARRIGQARGAFENCAIAARRREPDLVLGKVVVSATIEPSGRVSKVAFDKPALENSDVGRCLARVVSGLAMPPFRGEPASVDIPLMIGSGGAE